MLFKRFFWKAFFSLIVSILVSSVLLGMFFYKHLYRTTLENLEESLQKETEVLAATMQSHPELLTNPRQVADLVHTEDRITIIAPDGTVLADNWADRLGQEILENHANRPEIISATHDQPEFVQRFSHTMQREMIYYAVPIKTDEKMACVLRLSFSLATFEDQMEDLRYFLILAGILALLTSLPLTYLLSAAATRPIRHLIDGAHRLSSGDLKQPVQIAGSTEFQELAGAFNQMSGQLQEKIVSIQQEHSRMETLLARMVEGVLALDGNGKALFANTAFCGMAGISPEKLAGRSYLEIVRNDPLAEYTAALLAERQLLEPGNHQLESREIVLGGLSGERTFAVQASRIREENSPIALILVFHDITRIKMVEQIRKDFVANVSHELRTPLTALKGSTEVLLDGAYTDGEQCKKFLAIMDKQLNSLQNLVGDMLKLAAMEDTRAPLRREKIELHALIEDIVALFEPLAARKHQRLNVTLPEDLVLVTIDPQQISDALMNLIDNAAKYGQDGATIELRAWKEDGLILQVKDNGPGIPYDQLPRIFERFYRLDKSRSREMGGTGLGLAIVRHCVENHGGTVTVESVFGAGATFTIRLPSSVLI